MKRSVMCAFVCALLASATMGLSACSKAKSPDEVRADVARATREAAASNARADAQMKQTEAEASRELVKAKDDAEARAADKSVAAVADAAVTEAENANRISLARCEALPADAQQQCRDIANARLQAAKDRAKVVKKEG